MRLLGKNVISLLLRNAAWCRPGTFSKPLSQSLSQEAFTKTCVGLHVESQENQQKDVKRSTKGKARFSCLRLSNSSFVLFPLPGQLEINLNKMPKPAKNARRCGLHQLPAVGEHSKRNVETVSLFDLKRTNGWWPAVGTDDGEQILAVRHSIYVTYI